MVRSRGAEARLAATRLASFYRQVDPIPVDHAHYHRRLGAGVENTFRELPGPEYAFPERRCRALLPPRIDFSTLTGRSLPGIQTKTEPSRPTATCSSSMSGS